MTFKDLVQTFYEISFESSRLKITQLLSDLLKRASQEEAKIISYLSLGTLRAPYQNNQFNFAQKNIEKVLVNLLSIDSEELKNKIKETGDIGTVLSNIQWPFISKNLSITYIYENLCKLQAISGIGAQEEKANILMQILKETNSQEASFILRIIIGTMRLGFSDMTFIDALSWMLSSDKSMRKNIEDAYNICVDLGLITQAVKQEGIRGIDHIYPRIGIPIRPAAAERASSAAAIIEKIGPCIAQPKLDGFRLQIHIDKAQDKVQIWFYSRNLQDMSYMFPDLVESLQYVKVKNIIIEGEAIVYDEQTKTFLPFQETLKRKRKHDIEQIAVELPLQLFLFDILYLNDEILLERSHVHRRKLLISLFGNYNFDRIKIVEEKFCQNANELNAYFNEQVSQGLEGLVVKRPDAPYQPGKRNFNWIKLKRQEQGKLTDTIDAVILGYYVGQGKRTAFGIGAFLVGIYNKEKDLFETVAKIGTGLKDDEWRDLKDKCDKIKVLEQPHNVKCAQELKPDFWVTPKIVVVVLADEITQSPTHTAGKTEVQLGLALRFPRFMGYSLDKLPEQATSVNELRKLYGLQFESKH